MESVKGRIFNIVHGSFVDGWGIRTTVFLKGCPLRCVWCCNPESQLMKPELQFIAEHCDGCGRCIDKCPQGALELVVRPLTPNEKDKNAGSPSEPEQKIVSIDREKCDACGVCVKVCWPGAFAIWGEERTAEEVFSECLKDKAFYEESGGGITLSGGEATMQPEFCLEMIERAHGENIKVALDTCGQIMSEKGMEVFRKADTLLFDVKGLNPEIHKKNTGVDNHIILENMRLAEELNKDVIIRYPVIPNHNMEEAEEIADFLAKLSCVHRVDLIAYHQFGSGKYEQIGRNYAVFEESIPREKQEELKTLFESRGLKTQLGG